MTKSAARNQARVAFRMAGSFSKGGDPWDIGLECTGPLAGFVPSSFCSPASHGLPGLSGSANERGSNSGFEDDRILGFFLQIMSQGLLQLDLPRSKDKPQRLDALSHQPQTSAIL